MKNGHAGDGHVMAVTSCSPRWIVCVVLQVVRVRLLPSLEAVAGDCIARRVEPANNDFAPLRPMAASMGRTLQVGLQGASRVVPIDTFAMVCDGACYHSPICQRRTAGSPTGRNDGQVNRWRWMLLACRIRTTESPTGRSSSQTDRRRRWPRDECAWRRRWSRRNIKVRH